MNSKEQALRKVIREEIQRLDEQELPEDLRERFISAGFQLVEDRMEKMMASIVSSGSEILKKETVAGGVFYAGVHYDNERPVLVARVGKGAYAAYYVDDINVSRTMRAVNNAIEEFMEENTLARAPLRTQTHNKTLRRLTQKLEAETNAFNINW